MEEQKSEIQKLMKLRTTTLIYFPLHLSDPSSSPPPQTTSVNSVIVN